MTDDATRDDRMEALFAAARLNAPEPSAELMARVWADAEAVQAAGVERRTTRRKPRAGLRAFIGAFGGWPAMAGLTAAGVAGIALGISPTLGVSGVLASYLDSGAAYAVDVMPGAELGLGWDKEGL